MNWLKTVELLWVSCGQLHINFRFERIGLNEFAAGFDNIAHQAGEHVASL